MSGFTFNMYVDDEAVLDETHLSEASIEFDVERGYVLNWTVEGGKKFEVVFRFTDDDGLTTPLEDSPAVRAAIHRCRPARGR